MSQTRIQPAAIAAIRKNNNRRYAQTAPSAPSRKMRDLHLFLKITWQLNQLSDEKETLEALSNFFRRHFRLDGFAFLVRTAVGDELRKTHAFGTLAESNVMPASPRTFPNALRFPGSMKAGAPEVWSQVNAHGSLLQFVLLNEGGYAYGRLCFHRAQPRTFKRREISFFKILTQFLTHHMKKIRLIEDARELAFTDALTGIFNRRYFDQRYIQEFERAIRYHRTLSILMIDIDHFKKYNDSQGHPAGDLALKQVAHLLERNLRKADVICRFGGEEFTILLPEIDLMQAQWVGEKLRKALLNLPFPGEEVLPEKHLTISVGAASFPECSQKAEELLGMADKALYRAKRGGRNKVVGAVARKK